MDTLSIIDKWRYIGIIHTAIESIRDQVIKLLPPDFDITQNKDYDSPKNITEIL